MKLADKKCSDGGSVPPLKALRARELLKELGQGWKLNGRGHLERHYTFKDFAHSLAFVNKVGAVAEAEGHHPDLYLAWGRCKIEIWSHKIKGLTESDFVLAASLMKRWRGLRYRTFRTSRFVDRPFSCSSPCPFDGVRFSHWRNRRASL